MQTLNLKNVEISSGFSFCDSETGITINGTCSVDNQTRKVKKLQGAVYDDSNNIIGTVAATTSNDGRTFHTIAPYDMDDSVSMASIGKALFDSLEKYDYTPEAAEEAHDAEEGAES